MRLLIDSLVALMLAGVLAGVVVASREDENLERRVHEASQDLWTIQQEVLVRAALQREGRVQNPPEIVRESWFGGELPTNSLLDEQRPWVDLATKAERTLQHPIDKAALDGTAARFWYNPANGTVRARVPLQLSDEDTLDLYNRVNGTDLTRLYGQER